MSGLSSRSRHEIAESLFGQGFSVKNGLVHGTVRGGDGEYFAVKYDLLELAQMALELAGEKVEYEDYGPLMRGYLGAPSILDINHMASGKPYIVVSIDWDSAMPEHVVALAAKLLHAAATAREWASEGGES